MGILRKCPISVEDKMGVLSTETWGLGVRFTSFLQRHKFTVYGATWCIRVWELLDSKKDFHISLQKNPMMQHQTKML